MADKKQTHIRFRKVENGFIIAKDTDIFNDNGEFKKSDNKEFVSTSASETKKLITDMTEELQDEIS